jgi:hypothetical protein
MNGNIVTLALIQVLTLILRESLIDISYSKLDYKDKLHLSVRFNKRFIFVEDCGGNLTPNTGSIQSHTVRFLI